MAHDVFISYSSRDQPYAKAICSNLESRGIHCWMAPRDIPPGMDWGAALLQAISIARVMLLVFSSRSNSSPQIVREVEIAVGQGLAIIPVRIENITPTGGLGYFLGTPQWLDAITPPFQSHLERIADSTRFWLVRSQSLDPSAANLPSRDYSPPIGYQLPTPAPKARVGGKWRKTYLYILAGGVLAPFLLITIYFLIESAEKALSVSDVKPIHSPTPEANRQRLNSNVRSDSATTTAAKGQVGEQQGQHLDATTRAQRTERPSIVSGVPDADVGGVPKPSERVSKRGVRAARAAARSKPSATNATPTLSPPSPNPSSTQVASSEGTQSSEAIGKLNNNNFIVIGDSLQKSDADLLVKRFERFGYSPRLIPAGAEPNRYSLKFGPYSPAEAASARDDLRRYWHDLTFHLIVNSPAGPLMDQTAANSALEAVQRLGAHPLLVSRAVNGQTKYQVEIGPFVTQEEAMNAGTVLGQKYSDSLSCPWGNCDWQYTWRGSPPKLLCNDSGPSCQPDR